MPTETLIERAYELIHRNRVDEARPLLTELFRARADDPEAWALAAEIAPTPATREEALRKVADLSADNRLTEWAINELSRLKGLDATGARSGPPLPSVPDSWGGTPSLDTWSHSAAGTPHREAVDLPPISPPPAPALREAPASEPATPLVTVKPLPDVGPERGADTGFLVRSIGGWIVLFGGLILVGAILSPPFNHLITGVLMGWVALFVAVIGALVVGAGYLMS